MRSFQLSQGNLSARIGASPLARISTDWAANIIVIARALPSSFLRAFRSPPESGVGWCFGAMPRSWVEGQLRRPNGRPAPVFLVAARSHLTDCAEELSGNVPSARVLSVEPDRVGLLDSEACRRSTCERHSREPYTGQRCTRITGERFSLQIDWTCGIRT